MARFWKIADRTLKVLLVVVTIGLWNSGSLLRAMTAVVVGLVLVFVVHILIGWLAHRRRASAMHVILVANTVILTGLGLTIDQFTAEGLTAYSVFYGLLMLWLTARAAGGGTLGVQVIKANQAAALIR